MIKLPDSQAQDMEKKFLKLNDIECYRISFHLSNEVWEIVLSWDQFSKNTIGQQFARSVDSISANIAEGFGRYGKKDKAKFFRYAMGSTYESLDWNEKAKLRKLLDQAQYDKIFQKLQQLTQGYQCAYQVYKQSFNYLAIQL